MSNVTLIKFACACLEGIGERLLGDPIEMIGRHLTEPQPRHPGDDKIKSRPGLGLQAGNEFPQTCDQASLIFGDR